MSGTAIEASQPLTGSWATGASRIQQQATLKADGKHGRLLEQLAVSGVSIATATCVTNPIDVVKTRLQLQKLAPGGVQPLGMTAMMVNVVKGEGLVALWKGIMPATLRGLTYGGLRLGLYEPLKDAAASLLSGEAASGFLLKVLAGTTSGGLAAALTSPTELIKTRMQATHGGSASAVQTMRQVVGAYGVTGLWRGCVPGVVRAALLTASQCATYDVTKRWVMGSMGWSDHVGTQVACALITGLVSTTITNPADVVKTKMYVGGSRGPLAATRELVAAEGSQALLKGWLANYARLGPQTLVAFIVAEHLRKLVGLHSL